MFSHLRQLFLIGICCCTIPEPARFQINDPAWACLTTASQMHSFRKTCRRSGCWTVALGLRGRRAPIGALFTGKSRVTPQALALGEQCDALRTSDRDGVSPSFKRYLECLVSEEKALLASREPSRYP